MSWADNAIITLKLGACITIKPRGNSMLPLIKSGQEVKLSPDLSQLKVGDVVLVKVKGNVYLHLIKAIQNERFLIGNNHGKINGWESIGTIYGRAIL